MSYSPLGSNAARTALAGWFVVVIVVLYVPLLVLIALSFNDSTVASLPFSGFTTRWYQAVFDDPQLRSSLWTSVQIAVVSSLVSMVLASLAALGLARNRFRGRAFVYILLLSPLIMPFIVVGVVLLVFFKVLAVPLSSFTVIIGHALVILPYTLLILVPRLAQINPEVEEAARDLGATRMGAYWFVVRPLMVPALVAGFAVGLSISFDEYPVASFLIGDDLTFPVYLFARLRQPTGQPEIIAIASIIIVVTLAGVAVWEAARYAADRRLARAPSESQEPSNG